MEWIINYNTPQVMGTTRVSGSDVVSGMDLRSSVGSIQVKPSFEYFVNHSHFRGILYLHMMPQMEGEGEEVYKKLRIALMSVTVTKGDGGKKNPITLQTPHVCAFFWNLPS